MKIAGIIFVFLFFAFWGFYRAYLYFISLAEIENCKKFLDSILLYLESNRLSLKEIFENIKECGNEAQKNLSERIEKNLYMGKSISKDDITISFCNDNVSSEILLEVLMFLGKCSANEQIQKIKTGIKNIERRYSEIFTDYKQKAKLSISMGIIIGFFVVIILI